MEAVFFLIPGKGGGVGSENVFGGGDYLVFREMRGDQSSVTDFVC